MSQLTFSFPAQRNEFRIDAYLPLTNKAGIELMYNGTGENIRYKFTGKGKSIETPVQTEEGKAYFQIAGTEHKYFIEEFELKAQDKGTCERWNNKTWNQIFTEGNHINPPIAAK